MQRKWLCSLRTGSSVRTEIGGQSRLGADGRLPGAGAPLRTCLGITDLGSHPPVCSLQTQNVQLNKEMTLASNRSLAEGNLLYQPQLDALKARLTQKYQELQVLFEAYQIKKTKLGNCFRAIFQE